MLVIALGWRVLPGRLPGWIASVGDLPGVPVLDRRAARPAATARRTRASSSTRAWTYASTGDFKVGLAILVDPLSVFMCLVVSGVSFLIHLYSVAYMGGDRGYARFFAYLNFFVFSMLLLVLAANFVILIVGWAFVGAASYLLISFWYRRTTAAAAGIKAFVINVIGDVGPRDRARSCSSTTTGSLDYAGVFEQRARRRSPPTTARSWRPACCCWSARSRSRPSCRSTPGSRTRWRAPRRSPR